MQLFYLFSVKKEVEIRFNDVFDRKEAFFDYKNKTFLASQKWHFCKGVNPYFWVNNDIFFFNFFSVKKRVEIRFNDVLDTKQTFFVYKNKIFQSLKNGILPKGLTHAFSQKMQFFFSLKIRPEVTVNNV